MSDQFMNRKEGIRALREASSALSEAEKELREREGNRENLGGATVDIIGGLGQAVSSLANLLENDIPESTLV